MFEQGRAQFIQFRQGERDLLIRHHIGVQVETDPQLFRETVGSVERANRISAGHQNDLLPISFDGPEQVLLRLQLLQLLLLCGICQRLSNAWACLRSHHDPVAVRYLLGGCVK